MDFSHYHKHFLSRKFTLSCILPNFDESRFTFIYQHIVKKPKKAKQEAKFSVIFDTAVYSYIGSFFYSRGTEILAQYIHKLITENDNKGLLLVCALTQLAQDDASNPVVGHWFDATSCALLASDGILSTGIRLKCEECLMELAINQFSDCKNYDLQYEFNNTNGTQMLLPEIVLLMCASEYLVKDLDGCISEKVTDGLFRMTDIPRQPMHRLFVPYYGKHSTWGTPRSVMATVPSCIEMYGEGVTARNVKKMGKTHILLRLNACHEMKQNWIVTSYMNTILRSMVMDRYEADAPWYSQMTDIFPTHLRMKSQLVCFEDEDTREREYCVALSNIYGNVFYLEDIAYYDLLKVDKKSIPVYAFISATMGLYLRILAGLDINMQLPNPLSGNHFFANTIDEYDQISLLFACHRNMEKSSSSFSEIQERVDNIPQILTDLVIKNEWFYSFSGNRYTKRNEKELFEYLLRILNYKDVVQSGVNFISQVFKVNVLRSDKFVRFTKSLGHCHNIFDDGMRAINMVGVNEDLF